MKSISIILLSIVSLGLSAQDRSEINQVVTQLFVATDQQNWTTIEALFADKVELDYSSMSGSPAATLSPRQITNSWKSILPGFSHTHHQIGNLITRHKEGKAEVFCYGTATHYLQDDQGSVWTVVGSYEFELIPSETGWQISKMKFNFKYQDGNTTLPAKAIERAK